MARVLESHTPDIIISAAAYTDVDRAEAEQEIAQSVNAYGAGALSAIAASSGIPIIHLSTDYVFAGSAQNPYCELDAPDPQNVYGRTKLDGEYAVAAANPRHIILRTSWLFSPYGRNFLKTLLEIAKDRPEVLVVSDQWGNPTPATDLADAIFHVVKQLRNQTGETLYGTYHLAGAEFINRAEFARRVYAMSADKGGPTAAVKNILTRDFPLPASRPLNCRLQTEKFERAFGWKMPNWTDSLDPILDRILSQGE